MHSKELLKGTLQTIVLKVLEDNKKMYGYEITRKVRELSSDQILGLERDDKNINKQISRTIRQS